MTDSVQLLSLGLATPPHNLAQDDVLAAAHDIFIDRFPEFVRMGPVYDNAGVRNRQAARPIDWYLQPHGWADRAEAYDAVALDLFCRAAEAALDQAGLVGDEVDTIVTVSTTGISTPSLEARAMTRLGFRCDAARAPLFGLGCAGGATGLALAYRLAKAQPGSKVLLVCVELCTLAFRLEDLRKTDIISTAIFGDGAAACVLSSVARAEGFARVSGCAEHTWPQTLDIMGWRVGETGLSVVLDQNLPAFVRREIRPAMEAMLARQDLRLEDIDRFICHPGGAKVLDAIESAFGMGQGALAFEREVLADHGNMSSPTVLFVLERARRCGMPKRSLLTALGPGFTASTVTLEAA
jgi:alkylresorcinol/alkylpyrone synthase